MPQYTRKKDFLRYNIFTSYYACMNTRKSTASWFGENYIIAKKPERDQLRASPQSSPKINHMLITSLISGMQWKSSRFLFPVSTVPARNA